MLSRLCRKNIVWVGHFLADFQQIRSTLSLTHASTPLLHYLWILSTEVFGFILKVDAGFHEDRCSYSVGMVVLDGEDRLREAACKPIRLPDTVLGAELAAIWEGLIWFGSWNDGCVVVLSDSTTTVAAVGSNKPFFVPEGFTMEQV